jgi:DNA-binding MarR family transcriptional regulator
MKSKSPTQTRSTGLSLIEYDNIAFNEEERHAWSYFLKAYKVATEGVDKSLRENSPLSLAEFEILHKVGLTGGRIRFIDLARITLLSQSRISRQIDALQAKGFLRREITASDNRATFAVITTEGERALEAAMEPFARAYHRHFLDIIPKGRLSSFSSVLRLLMQNEDYVAVYRETIERARADNGLKSRKQD